MVLEVGDRGPGRPRLADEREIDADRMNRPEFVYFTGGVIATPCFGGSGGGLATARSYASNSSFAPVERLPHWSGQMKRTRLRCLNRFKGEANRHRAPRSRIRS
jgi:hypothetical protein